MNQVNQTPAAQDAVEKQVAEVMESYKKLVGQAVAVTIASGLGDAAASFIAAEGFREGEAAFESKLRALLSGKCLHQIAEPSAAPHAAGDFGRAALEQYLKECEENQVVPDVGGAFAYAWQRAAAPQAVQAAVPLNLDFAPLRGMLGSLNRAWEEAMDFGYCPGSAPHQEAMKQVRSMQAGAARYLDALESFTAPAHPAEGVPAQEVATNAVEAVTKAILFEDVGSTEDWEINQNLGLAAIKAYGAMDAEHWAELHRLREEVKRSDGTPWQKVAAQERMECTQLRAALAATQPAAQGLDAEDLDAWECEACNGTGIRKFDGYGDSPLGQYPITWTEECGECNATGWCGPDAAQAAKQGE